MIILSYEWAVIPLYYRDTIIRRWMDHRGSVVTKIGRDDWRFRPSLGHKYISYNNMACKVLECMEKYAST